MEQHLAQCNVVRLRAPEGDPLVQPFFDALDRINAVADASPGFVWRLSAEPGPPAAEAPDDPLTVVNLSVWESYADLHAFTYRSEHAAFVRRSGEWFEPSPSPGTVLWWVPAGERPPRARGVARLRFLRTHGPGPKAFSLRQQFDPAGHPVVRPAPADR